MQGTFTYKCTVIIFIAVTITHQRQHQHQPTTILVPLWGESSHVFNNIYIFVFIISGPDDEGKSVST
jgi:hypothetical protein